MADEKDTKYIASSQGADTPPTTPKQVLGLFNYYNGAGTPTLNDLSIISGMSPDNKSTVAPITDLRSLPRPLSSYNHDTHGFQIVSNPLPISPSPSAVHSHLMTTVYYPSMCALLRNTLHCRSATVRKHSLRDTPNWAEAAPLSAQTGFELASLAPFHIAHGDYTPAGARGHFRAMRETHWYDETGTADGCTTAEERELFLSLRREVIAAEDRAMRKVGIEPGDVTIGEDGVPRGGIWDWDGACYDGPRYAFFSVWRAWETVKRDPLAVMDCSRMGKGVRIEPLTRTYQGRPGCEGFYYSQNAMIRPPESRRRDSGLAGVGEDESEEGHPWCYLSNQTPEEVYLIKFFDSEALVRRARGDHDVTLMCPHSAFHVEGTDEEPMRRSCELRVWCIW